MTTADTVMDRALALATEPGDTAVAVKELLACCGNRRVSVVMAHRYLLDRLSNQPNDTTARAVELVTEALRYLDPE